MEVSELVGPAIIVVMALICAVLNKLRIDAEQQYDMLLLHACMVAAGKGEFQFSTKEHALDFIEYDTE